MRNYVQPGDGITVAAPGPIQSGDIVTIGALIGVAATDAGAGDDVSLALRGVFDLPKAGAEILALGDEVEVAAGEVTALDAGTKIGVVVADASADDTTARVRIG